MKVKLIIYLCIIITGCTPKTNDPVLLKSQLRKYLEARNLKDDSYWQYCSDTITTWFDQKTGPGNIRLKGQAATGPWTDWDKEMNSYSTFEDSLWVDPKEHSVSGTFFEHNDFYELIGKGPTKTTRTFWFNKNGLIREILIVWDPSNTLTGDHLEPVVDWALKNDSVEITELYPDQRIIPSTENAKRWKELLRKYNEVKKER